MGEIPHVNEDLYQAFISTVITTITTSPPAFPSIPVIVLCAGVMMMSLAVTPVMNTITTNVTVTMKAFIIPTCTTFNLMIISNLDLKYHVNDETEAMGQVTVGDHHHVAADTVINLDH